MIEVKEMTYGKKYITVLKFISLLESFVLPIVKKYLGNQGLDELNKLWQGKLKPIPQNITDKDKFETAYSNWMWKWSTAYKFIQNKLGEEGTNEFKRADIEALKSKNSGFKILILNTIRVISPQIAFSMIEKQMAYDFQVFSPLRVIELSKKRLIFDIPQCKLLDFPECEETCLVGCQEIFPQWLEEQFYTRMDTNSKGKSCTVSLTPIM